MLFFMLHKLLNIYISDIFKFRETHKIAFTSYFSFFFSQKLEIQLKKDRVFRTVFLQSFDLNTTCSCV